MVEAHLRLEDGVSCCAKPETRGNPDAHCCALGSCCSPSRDRDVEFRV